MPFIGKNRWRLPAGQSERNGSLEGDGGTADGRTQEELQLEREAAEAVLRGMYASLIILELHIH